MKKGVEEWKNLASSRRWQLHLPVVWVAQFCCFMGQMPWQKESSSLAEPGVDTSSFSRRRKEALENCLSFESSSPLCLKLMKLRRRHPLTSAAGGNLCSAARGEAGSVGGLSGWGRGVTASGSPWRKGSAFPSCPGGGSPFARKGLLEMRAVAMPGAGHPPWGGGRGV